MLKLPQLFVGANTGFQGLAITFLIKPYVVAQLGLSWDLFMATKKSIK